ncbi:Protein unc-45 B [Orchesella cincta]|uniref:Protein unc-45 B n=1 Tax=Orchesella cincta TaxID=48709 RepID=A0A1D2NCC3_ORCCI|nr:Protein unc-45 B [Orchesella cincta]
MKDTTTMAEDPLKIKEEANELFKVGQYENAIDLCNKALEICKDDNLRCILHKNAAASHLKLKEYDDTIKHCDKALEMKPQDPKALYRRALALEALERFEEAYRDAQKALVASPVDANTFKPLLSRLHPIVQERRNQFSQTREKALKMVKLAFGEDPQKTGEEDLETGLNNIVVLCRERAGIECLLELGILPRLKGLLELKRPTKSQLSRKLMGVRALSSIVSYDSSKAQRVLKDLGIPFLLNLQDIAYGFGGDQTLLEESLISVQYLWQSILNSLSGTKKGSKPNKELMAENKPIIDTFFTTLTMTLNSRAIQGEARDSIIQLFTKNIDHTSLNWAERFVEVKGLQRLADIGAEVSELKIESSMIITSNTRALVGALFNIIYDNMFYDGARRDFLENIEEFSNDLLRNPDFESKIRVTALITLLLNGAPDVGNTMIGKQGILQMILVMANSEEYIQQRVATEAIVAAASKKDKAKGIINEGINILKRLYQSKNDEIKVRALVGLCKLGSAGGTDASWRPFADGSTIKLAEACRRFLLNPAQDISIQRWAVEGLSYLTLDADVKEKLIEDKPAVKTMLEISRHASHMGEIVYPIIMTLVNLLNAYDKKEVDPEMIELAKFSKVHIPEEHEFDDPDFVLQRVEVLAELGVTSCLVNLAKATESVNVMELISRILNAVCERENLRGMVVAQGGARELIRIALKSNEKGRINASQALARIGVNTAPSVAFPGQRMYEVIKPLLNLLDMDRTALENFEALLALCNVVGESESCQKRIFEEMGFMKIEHYAYEKHTKLRMAAVQCLSNLASAEQFLKYYEGDNDRVKFMMMLCHPDEELTTEDKDDIETMKAASAILAILTATSRVVCGKILTCIKSPLDILIWLIANPVKDLQVRGVTICRNIIKCDKELAERLVGSPVFELMMALSQNELPAAGSLPKEEMKKHVDVKERCLEAMQAAEEWGHVKKT